VTPKKLARTKTVKNRDGSRSSVSSTPTLEEYRESLLVAAPRARTQAEPDREAEVQAPTHLLRPRGKTIVRSTGEGLSDPRPNCDECGRSYLSHFSRNSWCKGYVDPTRPDEIDPVVLDIDLEEEDYDLGPVDAYQAMDWRLPAHLRVDDDLEEMPTWLEAAGMTPKEWAAEQRSELERAERLREERQQAVRLEEETAALTEQWREEVEGR
jgi:hypothetical protein